MGCTSQQDQHAKSDQHADGGQGSLEAAQPGFEKPDHYGRQDAADLTGAIDDGQPDRPFTDRKQRRRNAPEYGGRNQLSADHQR